MAPTSGRAAPWPCWVALPGRALGVPPGGPGRPQRWLAIPEPGLWPGGQDLGAVAAAQAAAGQVTQVHRGGPALEPGVVPGQSVVAELGPASPPGGDLGDGALDVGPVCHVVLAQV